MVAPFFVKLRRIIGFNSMVPNYDICRVGLGPETLKALRVRRSARYIGHPDGCACSAPMALAPLVIRWGPDVSYDKLRRCVWSFAAEAISDLSSGALTEPTKRASGSTFSLSQSGHLLISLHLSSHAKVTKPAAQVTA